MSENNEPLNEMLIWTGENAAENMGNTESVPDPSDIIRVSFLGRIESKDEHGYIVSHVRTHKGKQYVTKLCVETKRAFNTGDMIYVVGIIKGVFGHTISVIPSRIVVAYRWC